MTQPRLQGTHKHNRNNIVPSDSSGGGSNDAFASLIKDFVNDSGGDLELGDVVVLKPSGDNLVDVTTTLSDLDVIGVVAETGPYADGEDVPVLLSGYHASIKVTGSVARGDYLYASTSPGVALANATADVGSFARVVADDVGGFAAAVVFDRTLSIAVVADFTDLGDVPSSYVGAGGELVFVKDDETGLEFRTSPVPTRVYIPFGSETAGGQEFIVASGAGIVYTRFGQVTRELNGANYPSLPNAVLEIIMATLGGGDVSAQLYDLTLGAAVAGTQVSTGGGSPTRIRTESFTLPSADHIYEVQFGGANPGTYVMHDAVIIMGDSDFNPASPSGDEEDDMPNEFMNFPSIEGIDNAQPPWWDVAANCTLTEVDIVGESITESYHRGLKVVTTADSYASQRFTYADQPRLKLGQTVSMLVAVWAVSGVTARARLQSSVGSLGVATSTAAAWSLLEVPAVVLNGTYVEARFEVNNGTAYFVPLGLRIGSTGLYLRPRGLRYHHKDTAVELVDLSGAAQGAWTDADATSLTGNLAAQLLVNCRLVADNSGENWGLYTRRKGSTQTNATEIIVAQAVIATNETPSNQTIIPVNASQIFQYYLQLIGSAGAPEGSSTLTIQGWWEWE